MYRGATHLSQPAMILCVGLSAAQYAELARSVGPSATLVLAPDNEHARRALLAVAGVGAEHLPSPPQVPVKGLRVAADTPPPSAHRMIDRGDLRIDLDRREAVFANITLQLPARSFDLLAALAHDPSRTWTFADLTERVWQRGFVGDTEAVVSAVKRLRRHLSAQAPRLRIESVRGVGFRLHWPNLVRIAAGLA